MQGNTKIFKNSYGKWGLLALMVLAVMAPLNSSPFDIQDFSNPFKYGWTNEDTRLTSRDNLFLQTMLLDEYNAKKQEPMVNALKTAIAPGWGHFSVRSYTKGQIFLGSQLVLLGTGLYYREKAMIEYRKYEKATQIDDINHHYDGSIIPYRQSSLLLTLYFLVWGFTVYDVVLETNNYNWDLWEQITGTQLNSNFTVTPTSITYRF